jgi:hypothetical protein
LCDITAVVRRPRDDPCLKCDRCACARYRNEWRVATTHPESIRTVHWLATRYSKYLVFSVCVVVVELSLTPLAVL